MEAVGGRAALERCRPARTGLEAPEVNHFGVAGPVSTIDVSERD